LQKHIAKERILAMTDNQILTAIEDMAVNMLSNRDPGAVDIQLIEKFVTSSADLYSKMNDVIIDNDDIALIAKKLQERFDIRMSRGTMFSAEDYVPWLDDARGNIEWYYWDRYKRLLNSARFPPQVIRSMNDISDQVLNHLENPKKDGSWDRRGMVVGHVQSGKTANYTALMCKAADCGYRVIIVLAGMLNSLRNQTQERIDAGFIGMNSARRLENVEFGEKLVGVGKIDDGRIPVSFTTSKQDFNTATARQISMNLDALNEPLMLVIKKHKGTLNNLIKWLTHNNPHNLKDHPMLLIDDEADHASINTKKGDTEVTAINGKIRELLHIFDRSAYVGYTATPFANIFIDPDADNDMLGDDLFPRDFIHSLDPPDNYFGPAKIFEEDGGSITVREVIDNENFLPLRHNIDFEPFELPASLKEAIQSFILARAIRLIRKHHDKKHNSMLINVSRFTAVQSKIKLLVEEYLIELQQAIRNHSKLPESEALKNSKLSNIKEVWKKVFPESNQTWKEIQQKLKDAVSPIGVIEVNSSSAAEPLDYSERNYPNGRNVIAVGGLNLSRGLTLEGLTVSYFLRNSIMYDTLMQMGRWFGYRDGYADICRIYMTPEAASWYGHISDVTEELREEFRRMKRANMTPRDFGLCVRSHPESLIVTARNKMRTGTKVLRQVNLEGRLVETAVLLKNEAIIKENMQVVTTMVSAANENGKKIDSEFGHLWKNVPSKNVLDFVESFLNHPACQLTEKMPLKEYIQWLNNKKKDKWDVLLVSLKKSESKKPVQVIPKCRVIPQERTVQECSENGIVFNKRRVASRGIEKAGLTETEIRKAESEYESVTKNIPDYVYRKVNGRNPLLMLHIVDIECKDSQKQTVFKNTIAAYGISFPGQAGSRRPEKLVEYWVNTTWWKEHYLDLVEENEGGEDE
jgi:hypothetical protein